MTRVVTLYGSHADQVIHEVSSEMGDANCAPQKEVRRGENDNANRKILFTQNFYVRRAWRKLIYINR